MAVPAEVSDPEVGGHKLDWWERALSEDSAHPALRALDRSGGWRWLKPEDFRPLLAASRTLLITPHFERIEELWTHCRAAGGTAAQLEARLCPAVAVPDEALIELGGASSMVRVVSGLRRDARANRWLVPLDLQAQYQVTRAQVAYGAGGPGLDGLMRHMLEIALRRRAAAEAALPEDSVWPLRHLLIRAALDARTARVLARRPSRGLGKSIPAAGLFHAWTAWRVALRLRRREPQ